jgi:hypothetical protein
VSPGFPTIALQSGKRHRWTSSTVEERALQSPDEAERRAATYFAKNGIEIQLTFDDGYSGNLHVYALDWDTSRRRQVVTVEDGNGPQTVDVSASFSDGIWMHFPIDVDVGGTVLITATKTAGGNAVISGLFLGE